LCRTCDGADGTGINERPNAASSCAYANNPRRDHREQCAAGAARGALQTGVGYFEHVGTVRDRQEVAIRFTSGQLNDVLKSITTIDMGKGQIVGISYNSIAPVEQRLGALRLPIGPGATFIELLASLRGARVEVGPGAVTGRLLSTERRSRLTKGAEMIVDTYRFTAVG
jgi:hypothetical protein